MKNHWLKKEINSLQVPLDYNDPSLDFFSAKAKIMDYLRAKYPIDQLEDVNEFFGSAIFMDLIENWAYAADRLSQTAGQ